jgi:hypothetical protein
MKKQISRNIRAHPVRGAFYLLLLLAVSVIPFALAQRTTAMGNRPATTITVTNGNDSDPGSLRQALADANDGDTINFDPSVGTVTLTTAELAIDKSVTLSGAPQMVTVARSSQTQFRIFHVMPGQTVTIEDLHITGGYVGVAPYGGGVLNDHANLTISNCSLTANTSTYGGAISSDGSGSNATLAVISSGITSNHAAFAGGGIYNNVSGGIATVSLMNSSVSRNSAAYDDIPYGGGAGGGVYNGGGIMSISNSTVSDNYAGLPGPNFPTGTGGGISNYGALAIINSTISGNICYLFAGGIDNGGVLTIDNSTVSGNSAEGQHDGQPWGQGGGIVGQVTFTNSTLSGNYANLSTGGIEGSGTIMNSTISGNNGGGISVNATLEIGNTVLKASASGPNISNNGGTVTSHGYNVSSDDAGGYLMGPGDQINTDPMLGLLQDNGGPTLTHALLPGSPAINTGSPTFTPPPMYDQRGSPFVRVFNGRIDIGSFEVQPPRRPIPAQRPRLTPVPRP